MKSTTEEDYEKYYWGRWLTDSVSSRTQASSCYARLGRPEIGLRPSWLVLVQLEMKLHGMYLAIKLDCKVQRVQFHPNVTRWQASSPSWRRWLLSCLWVDIGSESVSRQSFSARSAHFLPFCRIVLLKKNHKIQIWGSWVGGGGAFVEYIKVNWRTSKWRC